MIDLSPDNQPLPCPMHPSTITLVENLALLFSLLSPEEQDHAAHLAELAVEFHNEAGQHEETLEDEESEPDITEQVHILGSDPHVLPAPITMISPPKEVAMQLPLWSLRDLMNPVTQDKTIAPKTKQGASLR